MIIKYTLIFFVMLFLAGTGFVHAGYDLSELQKLFTDKQQREKIDAMRSGEYKGPEIQQSTKIKVSGYVIRSDGKSVVWLNNKNTMESSMVGDIRVNKFNVGKNKKVTVSVDGKTKKLKPGESWHREADKVVDSL